MTKTILKGETDRATSADVSIADPSATVALTGEHVGEAACPSNQQPADACEDAIRVLAYRKWEFSGCPPGDGVEFWLDAEQEVHAKQSGSCSAEG